MKWWRTALSAFLLVLVVLLAPASVIARWTHAYVGDTQGYLALVTPLSRNAAVQSAVADAVTDAVADRVNVPGLRTVVRGQLGRFVSSDAFPRIWESANREAHRQLVGVVTGEGTREVNVEDGRVSISLAGVTDSIREALVDRGVTAASLIPTIDVDFTIFESEHIVSAQRIFRVLDGASGPLPFLVAALLAGAIVAARARWRTTTIAALCVALGMGLLAVALALVRARYLAELPQGVSAPAAEAVFDALAAPIRSMLWGWLIAGLGTAAVLAALQLIWTRMPHHRNPATSPEAAAPHQEKP